MGVGSWGNGPGPRCGSEGGEWKRVRPRGHVTHDWQWQLVTQKANNSGPRGEKDEVPMRDFRYLSKARLSGSKGGRTVNDPVFAVFIISVQHWQGGLKDIGGPIGKQNCKCDPSEQKQPFGCTLTNPLHVTPLRPDSTVIDGFSILIPQRIAVEISYLLVYCSWKSINKCGAGTQWRNVWWIRQGAPKRLLLLGGVTYFHEFRECAIPKTDSSR